MKGGISPESASKLLNILLDARKVWFLKIELAAYVEVLSDLRGLCRFLQGDGMDTAFYTGQQLDKLVKQYPDGKMKRLRTTDALIMQAINWFENEGVNSFTGNSVISGASQRRTPDITRQVTQEVCASRPAHPVVNIDCDPTATTATYFERTTTEAVQRAAFDAEENELIEEATDTALVAEATARLSCLPATIEERKAHVITGTMPAIMYFLSRINEPSGDRYTVSQIFRADRLFNPNYVAMISYQEGIQLIDNFKYFLLFNAGEYSMVARLKRGWSAYCQNYVLVHSIFDFKRDSSAILSWNYHVFSPS